ncbi:MAG TPA: DUF1559 domain-containing protein, partial [Gemmataceae bacterium]|nr:DUF1559 domain-containing protein [Gemmataceae bacterium]
CQNNLKQMGLAVQNASDVYQQQVPPLLGYYPGQYSTTTSGTNLYGTPFIFILPFIEQQNMYNLMLASIGTYTQINAAYSEASTLKTGLKVYLCPSDPSITLTSNPLNTSYAVNALYVGISNENTAAGVYPPAATFTIPTTTPPAAGGARFPATIQNDGTSNTIVWTEKLGICQGYSNTWPINAFTIGTTAMIPAVGWLSPTYTPPNSYFQIGANQNTCVSAYNASSGHTGAILAGLGDGSVKIVAQGMSSTAWNLGLTPNDGYPMTPDW